MGAVDFLLIGGNGYEMLKGLKVIGELGTLDDILTEYINFNGVKITEFGSRIKNLNTVEERKAA